MKADERKHLEENALAHSVTTLVERAKSGRLVGLRWIGLALAAILIIGVWWYAVRKSSQADSQVWAGLSELMRRGGESSLTEFAGVHPNSTAARLARLEAARVYLGPDGISQLQTGDKAQRNTAVQNLEKARDEFTKLAEEFQADSTLRATALRGAAEAELALVGVPKGNGLGSIGSVATAADLYRKAAQAVGETTPVGEQSKKRADELEANKEEIERIGVQLYDRPVIGTTAPTFGGPQPDGPKAPDMPLPSTPPDAPKSDAPKAPDKPLTPPPAAAGGVVGGVATPPMPDPNKK
ncbi:MAG TPA: hypothetical protein VM533_11200 [Fimbriiglobus sp.]|jgi:hypothetical protein|nr:hypothetical protein [Fimbriiglobus sp.]